MHHYKPRMSKREIDKRRWWHKNVSRVLNSQREEQVVNVYGKDILVLPDVYPPIYDDSLTLARIVSKEVRSSDIVLDVGTGTGVQAIFAGKNAKDVTATDINPAAITCARMNVSRNGLDKVVTVVKANLFPNRRCKYDLIIFNPPFTWFNARNQVENALTDNNYRSLSRFLKTAKNHLKQNGRILIAFSTSGDLEYLMHLVRINMFNYTDLSKRKRSPWMTVVLKLYR